MAALIASLPLFFFCLSRAKTFKALVCMTEAVGVIHLTMFLFAFPLFCSFLFGSVFSHCEMRRRNKGCNELTERERKKERNSRERGEQSGKTERRAGKTKLKRRVRLRRLRAPSCTCTHHTHAHVSNVIYKNTKAHTTRTMKGT